MITLQILTSVGFCKYSSTKSRLNSLSLIVLIRIYVKLQVQCHTLVLQEHTASVRLRGCYSFSDRGTFHCFGSCICFYAPIFSEIRRCQRGAVSRRCRGITWKSYAATSQCSATPFHRFLSGGGGWGPVFVCWP